MKRYSYEITGKNVRLDRKDLWLDLAGVLVKGEGKEIGILCLCPIELFSNLKSWKDENWPGDFSYAYESCDKLIISRKGTNTYEITVDEESDYSDVKMIFSEEDLEDFLEFLRKLAIEFSEKRIDKKTMKKDYPELFEKRRR